MEQKESVWDGEKLLWVVSPRLVAEFSMQTLAVPSETQSFSFRFCQSRFGLIFNNIAQFIRWISLVSGHWRAELRWNCLIPLT
jgi:hypothetical protein